MAKRKNRNLHPSILLIISLILILCLELILNLFNIYVKLTPWIPNLPIISILDEAPKEGVVKRQDFFIWDRHLLWKGKPNAIGKASVVSEKKPVDVKFNSLGLRSDEVSKSKR